jgi:hypothetical protein
MTISKVNSSVAKDPELPQGAIDPDELAAREYRADVDQDEAERQYHEWLKEDAEQVHREEERRQWERAMPHKSIIFMDKMHECPHRKPEPILENIVYPGSLTILAADPKCGKSTFLFHALQAISEGKPFCGLKTRRVTTLYASEQPFQSLNSQVNRIPGHTQNSHVGFIPYEFNCIEREETNQRTQLREVQKVFPQTWIEQVNFWKSKIAEIKAGLFIVDTFTAFALFRASEANDSGPVTTRLQQLKSLQADSPDLAIVVCHHLRKEDAKTRGNRSFSDIANSYALRAASDMNIIIWKPSSKPENKNLRSMRIEGRFLEEETSISFQKIGDDFQRTDAPVKVNPNDVILKEVLANPVYNTMSIRKLAEELDRPKTTIGRFRQQYPEDHPVFAGLPKVIAQ